MLNKENLNKNLVKLLYLFISLNILLFIIAIQTSIIYLLYVNSLLILLIILLTPVSIIYNSYLMIKSFSKKSVLLFSLSLLSVSWVIIAIYYAATIMSDF
jgi:hypothetical protein